MPTFNTEESFRRAFERLSEQEREIFRVAVAKFVADLRRGVFRKGLRVKRVQGHPGLWEMTWANDGRAIFRYGDSIFPGEPHIVWVMIGGHEIFDNP